MVMTLMLGAAIPCAADDQRARPRMPAGAIRVDSQTSEVEHRAAAAPATDRGAAPMADPLAVALPSRSRSAATSSKPQAARERSSPTLTVVSSLAVVVGIFYLVAWMSRRAAPKSSQPLSSDVVQVLGRAPLAARHMMHLVRVGNKLLLVSITAQGATTLSEISDPQEVERLIAQCERAKPGSISATFRNVLHQFGEERPVRGFLGREQRERPT